MISYHSVTEDRPAPGKDGITGIILAGGQSRRMATNKALMKVRQGSLISETFALCSRLFDEVLISTNTPEEYDSIEARKIRDIIPGKGPLGGLYTGLTVSETRYNFVVACDMPFLDSRLIGYMASRCPGFDIVVPRSADGLEPLHAIYSKACLEPIGRHLESGDLMVQSFFDEVRVETIGLSEIKRFDPEGRMFWNINNRDDLERVKAFLVQGEGLSWGD